ncbi:MAG: DEAD/DEAH box helicase [Bacteroidales bacterium]|nr:DEAD/DEAH box helicase [Bacteroidales bacterium]
MTHFDEMGFSQEILRAIQELGFKEPMPVQEQVIPIMLNSNDDIIALAQTGTGKTAAFGLPSVLNTDTSTVDTQTLVLCPTRELCMQITCDLNDFAKYTKRINILAVYGGASYETQIKALKKGVHIIVATPGRLIDLINRGAVKLENVHTVILDEADEMLNMGFLDSINEILDKVPSDRRTLLFSATMSKDIAKIAKSYMSDPIEITIGTKNSSADNVSHGYFLVQAKDKYKVLKRIADAEPDIYAIIFCRTRMETQEIASKLINDGYNADALHGDLSQAQRDTVMQKFRVRNLQLLVATDVAARGLDVDDLTHVINYSLPDDLEVYTHRCGRTGRAGKKGISLSIINVREKNHLRQIERNLNLQFDKLAIPTSKEICYKQLMHWVNKIEELDTQHQEIDRLLPQIKERLSNIDPDERLRRIVSLQFDKFLDDYRYGEDIIVPYDSDEKTKEGKKSSKRSKKDRREKDDDFDYTGSIYKRYFINLGKRDGLFPEQLIGLINSNTKGKKVPLGKIDLMKSFSFFEMEADRAEEVIANLNIDKFNGREIVAEEASERPEDNYDMAPKKKRKKANKSAWKEERIKRKRRYKVFFPYLKSGIAFKA